MINFAGNFKGYNGNLGRYAGSFDGCVAHPYPVDSVLLASSSEGKQYSFIVHTYSFKYDLKYFLNKIFKIWYLEE